MLDRGREIWEARGLLLAPIPGRREPEIEQRIRTDLLDIITVWADLRVRLAPTPQADDARREVLTRLDQAAALLGRSPGLERLRRSHREALGWPAESDGTAIDQLTPRSAWEHCDLGRAYLRDGEHTLAARQFRQAVNLRPQDFWPNFYQGLCAYRLGQFQDALTAFRVCISLAAKPGRVLLQPSPGLRGTRADRRGLS